MTTAETPLPDSLAAAASRSNDRAAGGDWLVLVLPGMIWGASFLFIAEGLEAVGPFGVTFFRILVGLGTLALFPQAWRRVPRSAWGAVGLLGVLWMAFPLTMFPLAEERVSSALTGMLNGANPIFTTIIASALAGRGPSRGVMAGLVAGLAGAALVALPSLGEGHSGTMGIVAILAALVSYGFALNLARPLQQRYGAVPVLLRAQMVALVLTAPLGLPQVLHAHWTSAALLSLVALGALGTGVAYVLMAVAAGRVGATRASATTFLIPGVALLLGIVVRGEHVALVSVAGGAICVSGAWLIHRARATGR